MRQAGVRLVGADLLEHDLWPARKLPKLALVDRVVLLLAGFDLTCEISADGKTCRVVQIEYPLQVADNDPPSLATETLSRKPVAGAKQEFSLRLKHQPVGKVLEQLAGQLQLELTWDDASLRARSLSRETLVTCDVAAVNLDDLLQAILEPAGLAFTREGQRVEIHAAP
jgi:type II secretory pathway component HofQ